MQDHRALALDCKKMFLIIYYNEMMIISVMLGDAMSN